MAGRFKPRNLIVILAAVVTIGLVSEFFKPGPTPTAPPPGQVSAPETVALAAGWQVRFPGKPLGAEEVLAEGVTRKAWRLSLGTADLEASVITLAGSGLTAPDMKEKLKQLLEGFEKKAGSDLVRSEFSPPAWQGLDYSASSLGHDFRARVFGQGTTIVLLMANAKSEGRPALTAFFESLQPAP